MTNPAPRPALRKAEDSSVHPAAPVRPARSRTAPRGGSGAAPAATPVEKVEKVQPRSAEPKPARSRSAATPAQAEPRTPSGEPGGASGSASRGASGSASRGASGRADGGGTKGRRKPGRGRAFAGATSDHLRPDAVAAAAEAAAGGKKKATKKKAAFTDVDLMRGRTVELDVRVPKRLRKAAREEARRRGLDLDAVTTELLHRWLTGR